MADEQKINHWATNLPKFDAVASIAGFRIKSLLTERMRAQEEIDYYTSLIPDLDQEIHELMTTAWTADEIAEAKEKFAAENSVAANTGGLYAEQKS